MTVLGYLENPYQQRWEATVTKVDGKYIVLDNTFFYPVGGGQPADTGTIMQNNKTYNVLFAKKIGNDVSHEVDQEGVQPGQKVQCQLDWERRHTLMRYHTAAHLLSTMMHEATGAEITGNELYENKARVDFSLPDFDRSFLQSFQDKVNDLVQKELPVTISHKTREKAMQLPSVFKLRKAIPESLQTIRIITIGEVDAQACGGTHVKNTKEIGPITITKLENKGKDRKRIYFSLI